MDSIKLVEEFHKVFGHDIGLLPQLPTITNNAFRGDFMREELKEAHIAFCADDLIEYVDALGDLQYVLDGRFLNAGLQDYKDAILKEIHRSNMTKACKSSEEAQETLGKLRQLNAIESYHIERCRVSGLDNNYIVYRSKDRKVMKSIHYQPPNLKDIIYAPVQTQNSK